MTAYTDYLIKHPNMSFAEFAMIAARAMDFLHCISERPLGAPIPLVFTPYTCPARALESARADLVAFLADSDDARRLRARQHIEDLRLQFKLMLADCAEKNALMDRMISAARKWTPPTDLHSGLKAFMIAQLEHEKWTPGDMHLPTEDEWIQDHECVLRRRVDQMESAVKRENDRVSKLNEWLKQLRESLKEHHDEKRTEQSGSE